MTDDCDMLLVPVSTLARVYCLRKRTSRCLSRRCKDCDGAATQWQPAWELTDEAAQWEKRLGWPPDGRWTESNWPPEQPFLQLYQVRFSPLLQVLPVQSDAGQISHLRLA